MSVVQPLINPADLASFEEASQTISNARASIDRIPAELDEASAGRAADALKEARHALEDVETSRKAEKAPYTATRDKIDADFKELQSTLKAAGESLKARLIAYNARVQKEAEEERKRQERNAQERQAREDAKAEAEGRASHDKRGAPPPAPPPPSVRGDFAKTTIKKVKKHEIEDESRLPDGFVKRVPDRPKIKAAVTAGLVIDGVRVWEEDEVATR
jgi:transposase